MCLIVTIILFVLSIQNLYQAHWLIGIIQLLISFGFLWMLLRNIRAVKCEREGSCDRCILPAFITRIFSKKKES